MSSDNNPFDLTNKTEVIRPAPVENKKYNKAEYTQEQIKSLLNGYIEVPPDKWKDIPIESHIRYFKNDGTFARGGFVTNHWFNKDGKPFIHLANNFKKKVKGYATWPIAHESISKIYKKPDAKGSIEMDVVRGKTGEIISQINKLVDVVKVQKNRLDNQEEEIRKLYRIVKQLANK